MIRSIGSSLILFLIMSASPAHAQDLQSCRACCKEVYGTCKEGNLGGCDARYNDCLKKCLDTSTGATPKTEQPPKTTIPEIPPNPKELEELKKRL